MGRERMPHIGIYGVTNVGKSTLLNRLTGQRVSIVSGEAGTTTDPVRRVFEVVGYGPVLFIDTAGVDDTVSELGRQRVRRTLETLNEVDLAVVVLVGESPSATEQGLLDAVRANDLSVVLLPERGDGVATDEILRRIGEALPDVTQSQPPLFGERRIEAGDRIVFVCPIDRGAPAGRLILPQVQALRAALDLEAVAEVTGPGQLADVLRRGGDRLRLIVTDSQVFREVTTLAESLCPGVEVTSFSVLLAEQKGDRAVYAEGLRAVDALRPGDRILIIENCSHQITCDDIGRTKIPAWLRDYLGFSDLQFVFVGGRDPLPAELYTVPGYFALAVQCGGCVATRRAVQARIRAARQNGVPITNYGMLIRKLQGGRK